jgi:Domain of unknown function (DUF5122) beta-propeller
MVIQPDGKIVAGGTAGDKFGLIRRTADGSPDGSFGTGGRVSPMWRPALARSCERCGYFEQGNGAGDTFLLARYDAADGSLDDKFGVDGRVAGPAGFGQASSSRRTERLSSEVLRMVISPSCVTSTPARWIRASARAG